MRLGAATGLSVLPMILAGAFGCGGGGTITVTATLTYPSKAELSPLAPGARVERIRVSLNGDDRLDEAYRDLAPSESQIVFDAYPGQRNAVMQAEGFDGFGNLVAFARAQLDLKSDNVSVELPFRRTLVYITHRAPCSTCTAEQRCVDAGQGYECLAGATTCPACGGGRTCVAVSGQAACRRLYGQRTSLAPKTIYALDLNTRNLVAKLVLPGANPIAHGVSPFGGEGLLVSYEDGGQGFVALISSSDHSITKSIPTPKVYDLAVGTPGFRYIAAAGSSEVSVLDLDAGSVTASFPLGGKVVDAVSGDGGSRVVFLTSSQVALLDLDQPTSGPVAPGQVLGPGGIGISDDGLFAYITSSVEQTVFGLDLLQGSMSALCANASANGTCPPGEGLRAPGGLAVYSERTFKLISLSHANQQVLVFDVAAQGGGETMGNIGFLAEPVDLVMGPSGRRALVLSAGTASSGAGLTSIEAGAGGIEGSTVTYLLDPDDTFPFSQDSSVILHQRYQPNRAAVLYGQ